MPRRSILILGWLTLTAGAFLLAQPGWPGTTEKKSAEHAAVAPGEAGKGREIYRVNCAICHFSASTQKKIGPGMKDLYKRGKFADGKKVDDASVRAWVEKGGRNMPGFEPSLSGQQIRDLIAYLKTL